MRKEPPSPRTRIRAEAPVYVTLASRASYRAGVYFGILSSHSRLRKEVVPRSPSDLAAVRPSPAPGDQLELAGRGETEDQEPPRRNRWAWLIVRVFRADVETCQRCGGPMRWAEAATTRKSAARLLPSGRGGLILWLRMSLAQAEDGTDPLLPVWPSEIGL